MVDNVKKYNPNYEPMPNIRGEFNWIMHVMNILRAL